MAKRTKLTHAQRLAKYAGARHDLSKLKAKGLISKRANLRRAKPSPALLKKLDMLKPVLSNHAQAVKMSPTQRREYKQAGRKVYGQYVVFDKSPETTIKLNKRGEVVLHSPFNRPGFDQILLPVNVRNFDSFYQWITEHPEELDAMAGPFGYFGFTFYGNHARETGDGEWLREYLRHYKPLFHDGNGVEKAEDANAAFQHLTLYRLNSEEGASIFTNMATGGLATHAAFKRGRTIQDRRYDTSRSKLILSSKERHAQAQGRYKKNHPITKAEKMARADRQKAYRQRIKTNAAKKR